MGDTLAPEATTQAKITFTEFNVRQDRGRPHFIRLCDGVVERLERDAAIKKGEAFGILLGTVESDRSCTITVEDFEPAGVVEQHIRAWTPQPGSPKQVVGYYRSHLRAGFALDEADRALFERCFPKDARVALLVKPPKPVPGTGTFFLGEDGLLDEKRVTVEFPFDLRQLTAEEPLPEAAAPTAPASRSLPGGLVTKIAITGILVTASVVGLSALGVFATPDGQQASAMDFPKPQPPAPPAISTSKKPASARIAAKPQARPAPAEIHESVPVRPARTTNADGSALYTPPYAMRQFAPILTDSARQAIRGEVVVRVRVNVDASGAVIAAEPVAESQPVAEPLLIAATTAVKRWRFEPAQRGGQRVPSETVLSFTFRR